MKILILSQYFDEQKKSKVAGSLGQEINILSSYKNIKIVKAGLIDNLDVDNNENYFSLYKTYRQTKYRKIKLVILFFKVLFKLRLFFLIVNFKNFKYLLGGVKANIGIEEIIKREGVQIIHSHWFGPNCTSGIFAAKNFNIPILVSARGNDIFIDKQIKYGMMLNPLKEKIIKYVSRNAERLSAPSNDFLDILNKLRKTSEGIVKIVNGIDTSFFKTRDGFHPFRESLLLKDENYLILSIASLSPIKNHELKIQVLKLLNGLNLKVRLLIIGSGPLKEKLLDLARREGVLNYITFIDYIPNREIYKYMQSADLLLHCSINESFCNVIIESLLTGLPIVSTKVGVLKDGFFKDLVSVKIVDCNPNSVLKGIVDLFSSDINNSLRQKNKIHKMIKKRYSIDIKVENYFNEYCALSDKRYR
jgi:glycosyltransferase involved in cell wall biosynthesis